MIVALMQELFLTFSNFSNLDPPQDSVPGEALCGDGLHGGATAEQRPSEARRPTFHYHLGPVRVCVTDISWRFLIFINFICSSLGFPNTNFLQCICEEKLSQSTVSWLDSMLLYAKRLHMASTEGQGTRSWRMLCLEKQVKTIPFHSSLFHFISYFKNRSAPHVICFNILHCFVMYNTSVWWQ